MNKNGFRVLKWLLPCFAASISFFLTLRTFERKSGSPELRVSYQDGSSAPFSRFVFGDYSKKTDQFSVKGEIFQSFYSSSQFTFLIDDCLEKLEVNGSSVSLDHLSPEQRCDLQSGVTLNLAPSIHYGSNEFVATVKNKQGLYGFSIHRFHSRFSEIGVLSLDSLLLAFLAVWLISTFLPSMRQETPPRMLPVLGGALLVFCASALIYLCNIGDPSEAYWDENYYIADAQKYLSHTYFQQIHPPLGKLILAFSAKLFGSGQVYPEMSQTDYIRQFPSHFDFASYRILPAGFAVLSAVEFYCCSWILLGSVIASIGMALLAIFENAMVVHFRGAMLDAPFQFFSLFSILMFLILWKALRSSKSKNRIRKKRIWMMLGLFGMGMGGSISVKYTGAFLLPLVPAVLMLDGFRKAERLKALVISVGALLVVFLGTWHIHLSLLTRVEDSLRNHGHFLASSEVIDHLDKGSLAKLPLLFINLRDNLNFFQDYNSGIPKLDFTKSDENGSPAILWPIGAKGINYRWDKNGPWASYLQLQVNPVVYLLGLLGLILAATYLLAPIYSIKISRQTGEENPRYVIGVLFFLYGAYMVPLMFSSRVLFLYSYFPALVVSLLLFASCSRLISFSSLKQGLEKWIWVWVAISLPVFIYFSPLTYHWPLNNHELMNRSWIQLWDLHCADCSRVFTWLGH